MTRYDHISDSLELMNSMEQYASGLLNKRIDVVWGQNPSTDGIVINMPSIPKHANESLVRMHQSTLLHEAGHILMTDFALLKRRNSQNPMFHSIWNAIEDVWMESAMMRLHNGGEYILRDGFNTAMKVGAVKDGSHEPDLIPMAVYFTAYNTLKPHWDELEEPMGRFLRLAESKFGEIVETIQGFLREVTPLLESSRDCWALAEAIFKLLPEDEQSKTPSKGEAKDNSKALEKAKKESLHEFETKQQQGESDKDSHKIDGDSDQPGNGAGKTGRLNVVRRANLPYFSKRLPNGARLAQTLRPYLLDQIRTPINNTTSGRINPRHLVRVAMDDPRVFRKKRHVDEVLAAVGILIDLSGSMLSDNLLQHSLEISAHLTSALGQLNVACGVFGFGDKDASRLVVAKEIDHSQPSSRIYGLQDIAGGSTPLGEALEIMPDQFKVEAQNRLLFIITDGTPNSKSLATKNIKKLIEQGIEPIVINVGSSISFDPPCLKVFVSDVSDLSLVLTDLLKQSVAA
jgi:cobaltochelatase CobT